MENKMAFMKLNLWYCGLYQIKLTVLCLNNGSFENALTVYKMMIL
jgi:hypothetical protein